LEEFAMFMIRLHVRGQPAPVELPGWPDVFTAVVVRNILRSNPLIPEAEVAEVDAPRELFADVEEANGSDDQS
jgi:hypothetical protein